MWPRFYGYWNTWLCRSPADKGFFRVDSLEVVFMRRRVVPMDIFSPTCWSFPAIWKLRLEYWGLRKNLCSTRPVFRLFRSQTQEYGGKLVTRSQCVSSKARIRMTPINGTAGWISGHRRDDKSVFGWIQSK